MLRISNIFAKRIKNIAINYKLTIPTESYQTKNNVHQKNNGIKTKVRKPNTITRTTNK